MKDGKQAAAEAADPAGMCNVRATMDGVRDNGKTYAAGQAFHMHKDLVGGHVDAGQVELLPKGHDSKAQATPADKQVTGSADKRER